MDNRLVFFRDNRGRQSEAEAIWWFPFRHDGVPPSHHPFHGMFPDINQRAGGSPISGNPHLHMDVSNWENHLEMGDFPNVRHV